MNLSNEQLLGINGGGKWGLKAIGSAIVIFVIGIINGYSETKPSYCK